MKKFTTLETNDDVKKAVKQAAHMLDLADAEKVVLDTHEASASDLTKQYRAALDACMQAKRSGEGWEEKGAAAKKMLTLKQKLHDECDKYQSRIKKLYEPCSMFSDAREAYNRAYSARY